MTGDQTALDFMEVLPRSKGRQLKQAGDGTFPGVPKRHANDRYLTPPGHAQAGIRLVADLLESSCPMVLDPGAGEGAWGKAVRKVLGPGPVVHGVELRALPYNSHYDFWTPGVDFLTWLPDHQEDYDLIAGNPPYNQAEAFVRKGWDLLAPGGVMVYLYPLNFMGGQARGCGLWQQMPPRWVAPCSTRPSFYSALAELGELEAGKKKNGTDLREYAYFVWQKGWQGQWEVKLVTDYSVTL